MVTLPKPRTPGAARSSVGRGTAPETPMAGSATTYGDETMSNLETTVALDKFSSRVEEEISTNTTELRDDELNKVHG